MGNHYCLTTLPPSILTRYTLGTFCALSLPRLAPA